MYFGLYDTLKPMLLGAARWCDRLLPARLGRHHRLWSHVLPHRYHQKAYDDDFWRCRQVQVLHRLRHADPEERGLHVHDEGSRRQRAERCGRSRCARRFRQVQGRLHCLENQPVNVKSPPSPHKHHSLPPPPLFQSSLHDACLKVLFFCFQSRVYLYTLGHIGRCVYIGDSEENVPRSEPVGWFPGRNTDRSAGMKRTLGPGACYVHSQSCYKKFLKKKKTKKTYLKTRQICSFSKSIKRR